MHRTEPEVLSGACLLLSNVLLGCLKLLRSSCAWFTCGQVLVICAQPGFCSCVSEITFPLFRQF